MRPHFNPRPVHPNNQPQINVANSSLKPQQVMGNQGNFYPNPMQMMPQFQPGMLNNPQLAMQAFANQNAFFAPNQLFPFVQAPMHNPNNNNNNLQQLLSYNAMNQPQFMPNGQNVPNFVQTVNQLLQMQMQMQTQTQMSNCGPQNPGLLPNMQLGLMNSNGGVQPQSNGNESVQPPVDGSKHVNSNASKLQSNVGEFNGVNKMENCWMNPHSQNASWNPKRDTPQRGSKKRQFNPRQNANFKSNNDSQVKDRGNIGAKSFSNSGSFKPNQEGKKRSLALNYTAQEIQQWREARRKNYPSKANTEKLKQKATEADDRDAVTRKQQLKEVLAKQAELGVEVAEIPFYLLDSEQHIDIRGGNKRAFSKGGRFQNKFNKHGKFYQNDRFSNRQMPVNHDPADSENNNNFNKKQRLMNGSSCRTNVQMNTNKTEPSLLKKLLSSDIKRDKKHLLQAFRFMVINSFFENCPEKPLKFPEVIVGEAVDEKRIIEELAQVLKGETSNDIPNITADFVDKNVLNGDSASCSRNGVVERNGEKPAESEDGEILN